MGAAENPRRRAIARTALALALCLLGILPAADGRKVTVPRPPSPSEGGDLALGPGEGGREAEREWLAIGPFAGGGRGAFMDAIDRDWLGLPGGEGSARPLAIQSLDGPAWNYVPSADGAVFLYGLAGPAGGGVAYAYREMSSVAAGPALLRVTAQGPLKLWVNGRLAYARYANGGGALLAEAVGIGLEGGKNRILVKVEGDASSLGFALQVSALPGTVRGATAPGRGDLEVRLLERVFPGEAPIRGFLPGLEADGGRQYEVGAYDGQGRPVASCPVLPPLPFALDPPSGFRGPLFLRASSGTVEGPSAAAFVGDARKAALEAAGVARKAVASGGFTDELGFSDRGFDAAASLSFLADLLEGKANPVLERFDSAMCAIDTIGAIIALEGGSLLPGRAWRLAYRSTIDGSLQPYSVYLPQAFPGEGPAILLALHDEGESDFEAMARLVPPSMGQVGPATGPVIVAPYGRGESAWAGIGESDFDEVMALSFGLADSPADSPAIGPAAQGGSRLWLVGWGRGGGGALRLAQLRPQAFAAIASFGAVPGGDELDALEGSAVLLVRGKEEGRFSLEEGRKAQIRLDRAGAAVEFVESPGGSPGQAWLSWSGGGPERLLAWLSPHALQAFPRHVELRAPSTRYGQAGGLRVIDIGDPAQSGALSLEVIDDRHLSLSTENIEAFEIDLRRPDLAATGRILAVIDGRALTLDALTRPVFVAAGSGEGRGFSVQGAEEGEYGLPPHQGGGLEDLFRSRLRIVYGTKRPGRTAFLRRIAESLADWRPSPGMPIGSSLGSYPVLSDREAIRAAKAGYSVLLIGGTEDNLLSERLAGSLPVTLSEKGVSVNGIFYKGAGASLVFPHPEAAGFLLGMVSLPFTEGEATGIMKALIAPLRADPLSSSMRNSYRTPDLIVFDRKGARLWAASFGHDWKGLRSWYE